MEILRPYLQALIPLFVAIDAAAVVPVFLALTDEQSREERARTLRLSVVTGLLAGLAFVAAGRFILNILGVTVPDFQIAGGAVLFVISVTDLVRSKEARRMANTSPGVVPLGVPLIVGPAVLTTLLTSAGSYGSPQTALAFVVNMGVAWIILSRAEWITRVIGRSGTRGVAKVMSLLLAAIGVMMIRMGLTAILTGTVTLPSAR